MTRCQQKNRTGSCKPSAFDTEWYCTFDTVFKLISPKVPRRLTIFFLIITATKMPGGEALESASVSIYDGVQ